MNLVAERLAALRQDGAQPVRSRPHLTLLRIETTIRSLAARLASREHQSRAAELAAVLDTVSRRCASGESLGTAITGALAARPVPAHSGIVVPVLDDVRARLERGWIVREALRGVALTDPDITLAVHILDLCATQGGNVSESLDQAAATLRERHGIRLEREAQSAQARLSARVLTVVPVAFATWTIATTASVRAFIATPAGLLCVAMGAIANLIGWRLMRRAIRSTV